MDRSASIERMKVSVDLLREQRDAVIEDIEHNETLGRSGESRSQRRHTAALEGLVNMMDHMLDVIEGHRPPVYIGPRENYVEEPDAALVRDGSETDYVLAQGHRSCWVRVSNISVYIQRTDEGVAVDLWPHECEDIDLSPAGTWYTFQEATEDINCRKARDIGA